MRLSVKTVTTAAVIAALYAALTLLLPMISFGALQCRVSEALTVLATVTPAAIPGLAVGCLLANLLGIGANPVGWLDVLVGSAATLLAAVLSYQLRSLRVKGLPLLSMLMPVLINAVVIGGEWWLVLPSGTSPTAVLLIAGEIALGEAVSCIGLGIPLLLAIRKTKLPFFV